MVRGRSIPLAIGGVERPLHSRHEIHPVACAATLLLNQSFKSPNHLAHHTLTRAVRPRGIGDSKLPLNPQRLLQFGHHVIFEMRSGITHEDIRNTKNLAPGEQVLSSQTRSTGASGFEPNPVAHVIEHDEDVLVSVYLLQSIGTKRPTLTDIQ